MKNTRLTKMLAAGAACAVALSTAVAQETSTTTSTTAGDAAVTTTTVPADAAISATTTTGDTAVTTTSAATTSTGTISAYTPGSDVISFRTESSTAPVNYYYTKSTTVVDPTGKTVEISALRPDMPATVYYTKDGDRMVVTKVVLTQPAVSYEKKETTTTTTTEP